MSMPPTGNAEALRAAERLDDPDFGS